MENSQCENCRHLDKEKEGHICSAFPNGIPRAVYSNTIRHNHLIIGQVGTYVYEPKNEQLKGRKSA